MLQRAWLSETAWLSCTDPGLADDSPHMALIGPNRLYTNHNPNGICFTYGGPGGQEEFVNKALV